MRKRRLVADQGHRRVRYVDGVHLQLATAGCRSIVAGRPLRRGAPPPALRGNDCRRTAGAKLGNRMNMTARLAILAALTMGAAVPAHATQDPPIPLDRHVDIPFNYLGEPR